MTKPVIVTRAAKGSPLTRTELDNNFANLATTNTDTGTTFTYDTNTLQYFVVPQNVTRIAIEMYGAGGGIGGTDGVGPGAVGNIGKVSGTISVVPGETITVALGQGGADGDGCVKNVGGGTGGAIGRFGNSRLFFWFFCGKPCGSSPVGATRYRKNCVRRHRHRAHGRG